MAELATIARPYAEALFEATQNDVDGTARWLDALAAVAGNERLQVFANNPKAEDRQVYDLVAGLVNAPMSKEGENFLKLLIENKRLAVAPEVAQQYRAMKNARSGSSDAVVYSAFPMQPDQLGPVAQVLEKRFGRKLNFTVQEDPSLIGGIRVVVGDEVLDTSVKARLEQMKVALTA